MQKVFIFMNCNAYQFHKNNSTKATRNSITISHPKGAEITLHMNYGLEQNSKNPPTTASLHIIGFKKIDNH